MLVIDFDYVWLRQWRVPRCEEEFEDTNGGNQNPYIEEEQTTQCPKEKAQKDK